jgi:hypothetical protein
MSLGQIIEGVIYIIKNVSSDKVYIGSFIYGLTKQKIVLLLDDNNNIIQEFESSLMAAEFLNVSQSNISSNCRGINKSKKFNIRYK